MVIPFADNTNTKYNTNTKNKDEDDANNNINNNNFGDNKVEEFKEWTKIQENYDQLIEIMKLIWYWDKKPKQWLDNQLKEMAAWLISDKAQEALRIENQDETEKDWLKFCGSWLRIENKKRKEKSIC